MLACRQNRVLYRILNMAGAGNFQYIHSAEVYYKEYVFHEYLCKLTSWHGHISQSVILITESDNDHLNFWKIEWLRPMTFGLLVRCSVNCITERWEKCMSESPFTRTYYTCEIT